METPESLWRRLAENTDSALGRQRICEIGDVAIRIQNHDIEVCTHRRDQIDEPAWPMLECEPYEHTGTIQRKVPLRRQMQQHTAAVWERRKNAFGRPGDHHQD